MVRCSGERRPTATGSPLGRATRDPAGEARDSGEPRVPALSRLAVAGRDSSPLSEDRREVARSPPAPERWPLEVCEDFLREETDFFFFALLGAEVEEEASEDEDDEDADGEAGTRDLFFDFFFFCISMKVHITVNGSGVGEITDGTVGGKDCVGHAVAQEGVVDITVATVVVVTVGTGTAAG